ncbi:hypothetical protein [Jeongeupia sp. USM3]|uniref:hypothetical protein n=1 Tax=Jeongeupia sp. USM3 TaxID=1906741 RepID=UPI00089DDD81|nr:hypothetical protein [Jeongeupia sp. USM3]AOY00129.1 hypothetical protein BJP62_06485 [Jeongeupia sp. USM3]
MSSPSIKNAAIATLAEIDTAEFSSTDYRAAHQRLYQHPISQPAAWYRIQTLEKLGLVEPIRTERSNRHGLLKIYRETRTQPRSQPTPRTTP